MDSMADALGLCQVRQVKPTAWRTADQTLSPEPPRRPGAGAVLSCLEVAAMGICLRHDPFHLQAAPHALSGDAQNVLLRVAGCPRDLRGVRVAGITKALHGAFEASWAAHDEVHDGTLGRRVFRHHLPQAVSNIVWVGDGVCCRDGRCAYPHIS